MIYQIKYNIAKVVDFLISKRLQLTCNLTGMKMENQLVSFEVMLEEKLSRVQDGKGKG
ncbi:MAG: hypothetical protein SOI57_00025 [Leuconostoc gelidum]|uniref:hypothetical protein n=1 Tax=Leuconostoc gelidum TaxID=1244 RepID=UPI002F358380